MLASARLREHFAYENNGEIRDDITLLGWLGWHPMKSLKLGCRNPCINLSGLGAFSARSGERQKREQVALIFSNKFGETIFSECVSKPAAGRGGRWSGESRDIFIYSIRIEPSIFDFSVEILCKLYNIGLRVADRCAERERGEGRMLANNKKWRNSKLLNSSIRP